MSEGSGTESSEAAGRGPSWKPLWGGSPQYDLVCFEQRSRLGLPLEPGDDLRSLENSLSHPQVGLGHWDVWAAQLSPGSQRLLGAPRMKPWGAQPCPFPGPPAPSSARCLPGWALTPMVVFTPRGTSESESAFTSCGHTRLERAGWDEENQSGHECICSSQEKVQLPPAAE